MLCTPPGESITEDADRASPRRVRQSADWIQEPLYQQLLTEVQQILAPILNWFYIAGR